MRSSVEKALVAERGAAAAEPNTALFCFEFAADVDDDEVREATDAEFGPVSLVSHKWRPITDDFGQQLLSTRFVRFLLSRRPPSVEFRTVCGATLDMVRLASLFGFQASIAVPRRDLLPVAGSRAAVWLTSALEGATIMPDGAGAEDRDALLHLVAQTARATARQEQVDADSCLDPRPSGLGYEAYAFGQRDHSLLYRMQAPLVEHFHGCHRVLDIGCGTGLFLDALQRQGIEAIGVDRSMLSVRYARGLGHQVIASDVLAYLDRTTVPFDGAYCSHFLEHLPIEAVDRLISRVSRILKPGGVAVFVFPDPESIRSQLLGFWRDPEHVRFYHPDLIAMIGEMHGLTCEFHSHSRPGRRVVPFAMEPPFEPARPGCEAGDHAATVAPELPLEAMPATLFDRALGVLGLASRTRLDRLSARLDQVLADLSRWRQQARDREHVLRRAVSSLWSVNQTWAWEDNAVLRLRKHDR